MTAPTVLTERLTVKVLDIHGRRSTIRVDLSWSAVAHPEVLLSLHAGRDRTIDWVMARELLAAGLVAPAGEGDVRVSPDPAGGYVQIVLRSRSESDAAAVLTVDLCDVAAFLDRTVAVVPVDTDVDVPDPDWPGWVPSGGA
jgi:hypothetical protein